MITEIVTEIYTELITRVEAVTEVRPVVLETKASHSDEGQGYPGVEEHGANEMDETEKVVVAEKEVLKPGLVIDNPALVQELVEEEHQQQVKEEDEKGE